MVGEWKRDRADGPADVDRDAVTGIATYEEWCKDGRSETAPTALRSSCATGSPGTVTCEEWCKDGQWHRADGPAYIERDAVTGTVTSEEWWKDGEQIQVNKGKVDRSEEKPYTRGSVWQHST